MKPTEQAFEQHPELKESIQHAATFWKTDSTWSYHLNQINKVCEELHEAQEAISQMQPEWVSVDSRYDLPEIGLPVLVQTEYLDKGKPTTEVFCGYLDHDGELMVYPSDDPYGWSFKECVTQWCVLPQPPTK